jgi:hypothetical protein
MIKCTNIIPSILLLAELIHMMGVYYIQDLLSELVATLPNLKKDAITHRV